MILNMQHVTVKREEQYLLKDFNWQIKDGENWVLFGLNGAGKTTILNLINAYYFPLEGEINVLGLQFGKTYLRERLRKQIGYVSSALKEMLHPDDSAFEVVLSGAYASIGLYEKPTEEVREKAIDMLKRLGCFDYADRNFETLSHGEKQRVLIGRALMAEPRLLILDEPTNGLDFIAREQLLEAIENIAASENAPSIIYVTHYVEEILPPFNKTLLLKEGTVFAAGDTSEMIESKQLSTFFDLPVEVLWHNERPLISKAKIPSYK